MTIGTTNYPTSLDTATELVRAVNDGMTTIATGGATNSATTINVVSAASAPSDGIAVIVSAADEAVREIVSYTGKTATSLTGCTRNLESSGAKTWLAGDYVFFDTLTALSRTVLVNALIALQTKLGSGADTPASGEVLKATGTGTSGWSALSTTDIVPTATLRTNSTTVANNAVGSVSATCNAGEVVTGGGCTIDSVAATTPIARARVDANGFTCSYGNTSGATRTITAQAICIAFG